MKEFIFASVLLFSALNVFAGQKLTPGTYVYIDIENPLNVSRKDVPVVMKVSDITSQIKKFKGQDIAIFDGSKEIFSQYDDLDNDGNLDEVSFLIDIKAKGKLRLLARTLPTNFRRPNFEKEVFAELIKLENVDGIQTKRAVTEASSTKDDMYKKMYHHGVAFESDLMAYSLSFDARHTVDVYVKKKPRLEIAECQWYPSKDQLNRGFGNDVLNVGESVGVGAFRGWNGVNALLFDSVAKRTQRILATGVLRNVVEIEVNGWQYEGKTIDAKIRYIQYARHRDVEVQILFDPEFKDNLNFATGVMKVDEEKLHTDNAGLVAVWGTEIPEEEKYGKQTVGLAVVVPSQYAKNQVDDKFNHLQLLSNNSLPMINYFFTATALIEKKGYDSAKDFFEYLDAWKAEVLNPVVITINDK